MKRFLFSRTAVRALAVIGAVAAAPVTAASAQSTSIYATAQGTSVLGTPVPVLGTQGWTLTVPVGSKLVPQFVANALDFTVTSELTVGDTEVYYLSIDPRLS